MSSMLAKLYDVVTELHVIPSIMENKVQVIGAL